MTHPFPDLTAELIRARDAIKESNTFLLTCHIQPDGDALGSSLAMAHALRSIGKQVTVTFPDPFIIPESLQKTLPGATTVVVPSIEASGNFDVVMSFDCGSQSRLGDLDQHFSTARHVINVDHHISNESFGTINVIDVNAASSGSVVMALLDVCAIELTADVAQCLYVALLTDTGRFQFSSTTPTVFKQAQRLATFDLPIAEMSRTLTEEDPFTFLKLAGDALGAMQLDDASGVVSAVATITMQKKHGVAYNETEGLIEFVRRARESDVACVVKEFAEGDYRVSLRSLGTIDVCEIASLRDGGGHRYAAGFSSTDTPEKIIADVRADVVKQRASIS